MELFFLLLLAVVPSEAGPHSFERDLLQLQRCTSSGRLLDLTNGSVGSPVCVSQCTQPAVRTVQGGGFAFCLWPIHRKEALDISFTLALRNVSFKQIPRSSDVRVRLPLAVGQMLQVAPGDVLGEMMVRDGDSYRGLEVSAFQLRRRDRSGFGSQEAAGSTVRAKPNSTWGAAGSNRTAAASLGPGPGPAFRGQRLRARQAQDLGYAFPVLCTSCNVFLAVRCESWRVGSSGSSTWTGNALLEALDSRSSASVVQALGLAGNWEVLEFSASQRKPDMHPLEVVGAEHAFRYEGLPWNFDPIEENKSDWERFRDYQEGSIMDNPKFDFAGLDEMVFANRGPEGSVEVLIVGAVLLALLFVAAGSQKMSRQPQLMDVQLSRALGLSSFGVGGSRLRNREVRSLPRNRQALERSLQRALNL